MHEGNNMGIMTTFKKPTLESTGRRGDPVADDNEERGRWREGEGVDGRFLGVETGDKGRRDLEQRPTMRA